MRIIPQTQTGANPREDARQSFITAKASKAGSIEAKYGVLGDGNNMSQLVSMTPRQAFIDAELSKVGSMDALQTKYVTSAEVIRDWAEDCERDALARYEERMQNPQLPESNKEMARAEHTLIRQGLVRLNKAFAEAAGT